MYLTRANALGKLEVLLPGYLCRHHYRMFATVELAEELAGFTPNLGVKQCYDLLTEREKHDPLYSPALRRWMWPGFTRKG